MLINVLGWSRTLKICAHAGKIRAQPHHLKYDERSCPKPPTIRRAPRAGNHLADRSGSWLKSMAEKKDTGCLPYAPIRRAPYGDFLANRPLFGRDSLVRKNDGYYSDLRRYMAERKTSPKRCAPWRLPRKSSLLWEGLTSAQKRWLLWRLSTMPNDAQRCPTMPDDAQRCPTMPNDAGNDG